MLHPAKLDTQSSPSLQPHQIPPPVPGTHAQPSQVYNQPTVSNPKNLPPTPPLRPDIGFDGSNQSPSARSSQSSTPAAPPYYGGHINKSGQQRQQHPPQPPSSHPSSYTSIPPASQPSYQNSPFSTSSSAVASYSYPSPAHPATTASPMYYQQRPLPTSFPPAAPVPLDPSLPGSPHASPVDQSSPWQHQHHHYISPSSSGAFAGQPQDRYICQTCSKAFSRPSSLRIHSHSHTGEKPYKCPHPGCGKAFSVRSNMKRHERGCHGPGSPGST